MACEDFDLLILLAIGSTLVILSASLVSSIVRHGLTYGPGGDDVQSCGTGPVGWQQLPDPTVHPNFPSPVDVAESRHRELTGVMLLCCNVTRRNIGVLLYDCAKFYQGGSEDQLVLEPRITETSLRAVATPRDAVFQPCGTFDATSNWFGIYFRDQTRVPPSFVLIGFRDLTLRKEWRIIIHEQDGQLAGEIQDE